MKNSDISRLDWEILNALADDYESVDQIESIINNLSNLSTTRHEVLYRVEYLHEHNYVYLMLNMTFDRIKLEDEINKGTQDRRYWFGRTEKGYLAWQDLTDKYFQGKVE